MYWPEIVVKEITKKLKHPYHVDDMKTPSGQIHIGALRGVLIHDIVHKELIKKGYQSKYTYMINDHDPIKKVPTYLDSSYESELGKPLYKVKAPEGEKNFARYFADIFIDAFNVIGANPQVIFSSDLYLQGKFNDVIRESLDKVDEIRKIYTDVAGYEKPDNWYPIQTVCEKCGKVGTTLVNGWNGETVTYECMPNLVTWAKGCGYKGEISPFNGNSKLMWKVDWPAHWKVLGVNIEGAGKDHTSAGGSRDIANELCKLFEIPSPLDIPYEWFLTKDGGKMSTSKGVGMYAKDLVELLPPEVARFLILRTHYNTAILFEPNGDTIPDLYDEFDRCAKNYFSENPDDIELAKYYEASIIRDYFKNISFLPRFRTLSTLIQMPSVDIYEWAKNEKGSELTQDELFILDERIEYGKKWLKDYAPQKYVYAFSQNLPENAKNLSDEQKTFLTALIDLLDNFYLNHPNKEGDQLQQDIFELTKKLEISAKKAFKAIYITLIGKDHGPKAGWIIKDFGYHNVIQRFKESL